MTEVDSVLSKIKLLFWDAEGEEREDLLAARDAIKTWRENGMEGEIPYRDALIRWGIDLDGLTVNEADEKEAREDAASADQGVEDIDPELQTAFDDAVAMMNNGRYHSARNALNSLKNSISEDSPFAQEVERKYQQAARSLAKQVEPLIKEAKRFAEKNPEDLAGQRTRWEKVTEVDPDNGEAAQALRRLQQESRRRQIRNEATDIEQQMEIAVESNRLPDANRQFGAIEALAEENQFPDLQADLDQLKAALSKKRNQLRDKLGAASTLSVTGDTREAYKQASEFMQAGVPVMVDAAGLFGEVNAEVETLKLYQKTRERFIASLIDLSQQRRQLAEEQKGETPTLALETLEDALGLLDDKLLTAEDREELKDTQVGIENEIARVRERIERYEQARQLVNEANEPSVSYRDKLTLYRDAKEIYPEYRNLDNYIEDVQDALAAQLAGRVKDKMTRIRLMMSRDAFEAALEAVKDTRADALREVPQPKPDSELRATLDQLETLEEEIIAASSEYHAMMTILHEVDELLQEYAAEQDSALLNEVRLRLESIPPAQSQHPQVRRRRARLTETQGDRENWRQGVNDYRIREWADAITYLQKVADSPEAKERTEAERLAQRAQAALYVEEARQAEQERDWRRAIDRYKEANRLFDEYGSDEQTSLLHDDCRDKLDSLKPLEENDQKVRHILSQAESLIREGQQSVQIRRSLLERVEAVSQFQRAVNMLLEVRQQDTTLTSELERTLRDAREVWRKTYLEGMRQATRSQDVNILRRAVNRGEELQEQSLLYETEDKQVLQLLQEQLLDTEYDNLLASRAPDLVEVEENRRKRWEIANPKTDELYRQYQQAIERRVLNQLSDERDKSIEAALQFLKGEMRRPELYQSERLFREYMHLCWEVTNWPEARRQAESLAYRAHVENAKEKSALWVGLSQAARLVKQGDLPGFDAELRGLEKIGQENPNLGYLLDDEREWLKDWRTEQLIREAEVASQADDGQQLIVAAQLYAQANHLRSNDSRVQTGLNVLGRKLNDNLGVYISQAKNLTIRKSLAESIRRAEKLSFTLSSIQQVSDELALEREVAEELKDALENIDRRLQPWKKVQAHLERLEKSKIDYLTYPDPLRPDGSGGWRVRDLVEQMNRLRQDAQGDRELNLLVASNVEDLTELDNKADELNRQVHLLAEAIREERFSDVLAATNQLERLWNQYQADGFSGLDLLVRHRYSYTDKEIRQLKEHKQEAKVQQANWEEWQSWAEEVDRTYRAVVAIGSNIRKHLDDLRQDKPLNEIKRDCELVLEKTAEFEEALEMIPVQDPMSQKAAEARDSVDETWRGEVLDNVNSYQQRASKMIEQIEEDLENFSDPLRRLKSAVGILEKQITDHLASKNSRWRRTLPFPKGQLRAAKNQLKSCDVIDPFHPDVIAARKQLREIERKYRGAT